MLASYKWLKELSAIDASPAEVKRRFTDAGLEVEGVKEFGNLPNVVVAEVKARGPHPKSEKLTLVKVFDGQRELDIVCGAPNVPAPGKRVVLARLGAKLPNGMEIAERKVAGATSQGMLCSEVELDVGAESDGIIVLDETYVATQPALGTPIAEVLGLADTVFEIGLTPNRPDCLGHLGLARELSALFGAPLRLPKHHEPPKLARAPKVAGSRPVALFGGQATEPESAAVPLVVADAARCPRYGTVVVEKVKVGPSPFWLRYRLHVLGLRAISNAVDITNLVLLEYGYPTHAFDLELLRGPRIEVRRAKAEEKIKTLDGIVRELSPEDLLICDAGGPVAIAGVMGGEHSGIRNETTRVLVECAYFDPRSVRRTSRRLGLHTDSSHRFERGVDPRAVPGVLARVASLLAELAGGVPCQHGAEIYPQPIAPREITLRLARVDGLLGAKLPPGKAREVLESLGCEIDASAAMSGRGPNPAAGSLRVRAPTWRPDLTREEDLVEEVARVWGYDKIPSEMPSVKASSGGTLPLTRFVRRMKERAAAAGLTEVVNLAFVSDKQLARARVSTASVRLANPLSEERTDMRTSLLPGIAANVLRAQRHQVPSVALFELARTFTPSGEVLPEERYQLALALWGERRSWVGDTSTFDFYDGKGYLEAVLKPLTRLTPETRTDVELSRERPFLHPRRAARVLLGGRAVGVLGELHPDVADDLELSGAVVYAELDVSSVLEVSRGDAAPQVRPTPRFPASTRDLAIEIDEGTEAGTVAAQLHKAGGELVESVELFDVYRGAQVGAGKKSLAFRITYRDPTATLTDQRVDEAHARVAQAGTQLGGAAR
jgi:phenylalanyl-tRNA synthetase beta chain